MFNRPTGQLDAYIKNLERVLDAIEFFNQNNPNCMELSNLVCLGYLYCNFYNIRIYYVWDLSLYATNFDYKVYLGHM